MNVLHLLGACLVSSVSGLAPVRHDLHTYSNGVHLVHTTEQNRVYGYVFEGSEYSQHLFPHNFTYTANVLYSSFTFVTGITGPSVNRQVEFAHYGMFNTNTVNRNDAPYYANLQLFKVAFADTYRGTAQVTFRGNSFDFVIGEHFLYDDNLESYFYFRNFAIGNRLVNAQYYCTLTDTLLGCFGLPIPQIDVSLISDSSYINFSSVSNTSAIQEDYGYVQNDEEDFNEYMQLYISRHSGLVPYNNVRSNTYFNTVILNEDTLVIDSGYIYPFMLYVDGLGYDFYDELNSSNTYKYLRCQLSFMENDDLSYTNGYNAGKDYGQTIGYNSGYSDGKTDGYQEGYNVGLNATDYNFMNLFGAIADTPVLIIRNLFDFDLFGVSALTVVLTLFTALVVIYIAKKIL